MAPVAPEGDVEGNRAGAGRALREDAGAHASGCGAGEGGGLLRNGAIARGKELVNEAQAVG